MGAKVANGVRIGILGFGYPERRNMLDAGAFGIEYVLIRDWLTIVRKVWHSLSGQGYSGILHSFAWVTWRDGAAVHSFNSLVYGGMPWVVTFETTLPRVGSLPGWVVWHSWKKIARSECRALLALSDCTAKRLLDDLQVNRPRVSDATLSAIRGKLSVLHPPQPLLIDGLTEKLGCMEWDGPLRIVVVGHDFYRKGGLEVLLALEALIGGGKDIRLSIAGKMIAGDYASRAGAPEVQMAEAIISRHPDRIQRLGSIPSSEVHGLLRTSHVLCLATWGDTYGYSVLEAQAAGCATITTDLRALPEINNGDCGWLIKVPKLANGDGDLDSVGKRERFRAILVEGIKAALREAHDDRDGLQRKAAVGLERIRKFHDPAKHAARLAEIYQQAGV
jgi:glycosyltransferase involved in cell wall biosynthesis